MSSSLRSALDHGDTFALARVQEAFDRKALSRFPELALHKRARMSASPHALFRGSAPLFHELLRAQGGLEALPKASGTIVGDMHLENVGAYRVDGKQAPIVFDLNDFDDAAHGIFSVDVLRLSVSVLLAGRTFGTSASLSLSLVEHGLEQHARMLASSRTPHAPEPPTAIRQLVTRAESRTTERFLDRRAPRVGGDRHFVLGPRYLALPEAARKAVPELVRRWLEALGARAPKRADRFLVVDAAQRVAGTGSLGALRIAVLLDDGDGTLRIAEFKEARSSSVHPWPVASTAAEKALALDEASGPAERVVACAHALVERPTRRLAAVPRVRLGRESLDFVGRMLAPQEDKLDLATLDAWSEKESLVGFVYHLLGRAHRRSIEGKRVAACKDSELASLLDRAVLLAGLFEGIALAYARIAEPG